MILPSKENDPRTKEATAEQKREFARTIAKLLTSHGKPLGKNATIYRQGGLSFPPEVVTHLHDPTEGNKLEDSVSVDDFFIDTDQPPSWFAISFVRTETLGPGSRVESRAVYYAKPEEVGFEFGRNVGLHYDNPVSLARSQRLIEDIEKDPSLFGVIMNEATEESDFEKCLGLPAVDTVEAQEVIEFVSGLGGGV